MKDFAALCGLQKHFVESRTGIAIQVILKAKEVHDCGTEEKLMQQRILFTMKMV